MTAVAFSCDDGQPGQTAAVVAGFPALPGPRTVSTGGWLGFAVVVSLAAHAVALLVPYAVRPDRLPPPSSLVLTIVPPREESATVNPVEPQRMAPRPDDRPRRQPVEGAAAPAVPAPATAPAPAAASVPIPLIPAQLAEPVAQRNEPPATPARAEPPAAATARVAAAAPPAVSEGSPPPPRPDAGIVSGAPPAAVATLSLPPRESARPAPAGGADRIEPPRQGVAYLHKPQPTYPRLARDMRLEGTVVVRFRVSVTGLPEEVTLAESSGSDILDNAALREARTWRFIPERRGDTPVVQWAETAVIYRLNRE